MNNIDWKEQAKELDRKKREKFASLLEIAKEVGCFDEDGYPSDAALELIANWHWSDPKGWFEFIESLWSFHDFGWTKEIGGRDDFLDQPLPDDTVRYHLSTAGWSGNESIIHAMERTDMLWGLNWVQSRRGGHYIFELYEVLDDREEE